MIRSGSLDREIIIERATVTLDDAGTPVSTWATLANMRAQLLDGETNEKIDASGAVSDATVRFRTRWLDGLTLADRLTYQGEVFTLKHIQEIGRRRALELQAQRLGP